MELADQLRHSVKVGRKGVTVSGQGVADLLMAVAPRIPVRSAEDLSGSYGGMTGTALAGQMIRQASRQTGAVGGATGAVASANMLAPPLWIMLPVELVAETLLIAAIEMRLVAELHGVYGRPITGTPDVRGVAILKAWAEQRGVNVEDLSHEKKLSKALGRGTTNHVVHIVKRKLMSRLFRNVSTFAPLFVGAVVGAELNRRSTRDLGDRVVKALVMDTASK